MRTLVLLVALLLLAFQVCALFQQQAADDFTGQDQTMTNSQGQAGTEDQGMVITLRREQSCATGTKGFQKKKVCTCRKGNVCQSGEAISGSCKLFGTGSNLCCS